MHSHWPGQRAQWSQCTVRPAVTANTCQRPAPRCIPALSSLLSCPVFSAAPVNSPESPIPSHWPGPVPLRTFPFLRSCPALGKHFWGELPLVGRAASGTLAQGCTQRWPRGRPPPVKPFLGRSRSRGAPAANGTAVPGPKVPPRCAVAGGDKCALADAVLSPPPRRGLRSSSCYLWIKIYGFRGLVILGWTAA